MVQIPHDPVERARRYLRGRQSVRETRLGWGTDGVVFSVAETSSVIKVHETRNRFENELRAYQRLAEHEVDHVGRFTVPQLRNFDTTLLVIEISHVTPPFLIDFGKSALDEPTDFTPEGWAWWQNRMRFKFGRRAPEALTIYERLVHEYGIYHHDLSPDNLRVPDEEAAQAHEGLDDEDDDPDHAPT